MSTDAMTRSATVRRAGRAPTVSAAGAVRRALATTPIGELLLVPRTGALCEIRLPDRSVGLPRRSVAARSSSPPLGSSPGPRAAAAASAPLASPAPPTAAAVLDETRRQLAEYFAGERREFDLPLGVEGTGFQRQVWGALAFVGYGETVTYAELARAVGRPGAARAVGAALASNPLPVVVPCHRVVGARGDLRGFAGGLDRKRYLLEIEAAFSGS